MFENKFLSYSQRRFILLVNLINLTICCYLFRTSIPFLKYPFILFSLLVIFILNYKHIFSISFLLKYIKLFWIFIILFFQLLLSFIFTPKIYLIVTKDLLNSIIIFYLFFILYSVVQCKNDFKFWSDNFNKCIVFFAIVISFYILGNLLIVFPSSQFYADYSFFGNPLNGLINFDYNFSLLPVILGLLIIILYTQRELKIIEILVLNCSMIVCFAALFFSGSRRGLFVLIIMLIFLVTIQLIYFLYSANVKFKNIVLNTRPFFIIIFIILSSICIFFSFASYQTKLNAISCMGSKNVILAVNNINNKLLRYAKIYNENISYYDVFRRIWSPQINPNDPNSGWGSRVHLTVFPLEGENVEIVPKTARGYLMNKNCNSHTWNNNAYSFTVIGHSKVTQGDKLCSSVFCYVSKDFDGENAYLFAEGSVIGDRTAIYDMNKKGSWQKLNLNLNCINGESLVSIYFNKYGVSDFSSLNGYVIFAYPEYRIFNDSDGTINYFDSKYSSHIYLRNKMEEYDDKDSPKHLNSKQESQKLGLLFLPSNVNFTFLQNDPINRINKLFVEDSIYIKFNKNLQIDSVTSSFFSDRICRWKFAKEIFFKEFSTSQKLFGGGFLFLNWYGYVFVKDKYASDWPHNPFLAILLYSGLFGIIFYILSIWLAIYYYYIYFKNNFLYFIFFMIIFFFSFFSGSSPFDPPILGFFTLLPFFMHRIFKE